MSGDYSFFKDALALVEIRKHQWIESQKIKKEVSFASAALDWITKYGPDWKKYRLDNTTADNPFTEKRGYRRFEYSAPVVLKLNNKIFHTETNSVSLIGFSCLIPEFIEKGTTIEVTIQLSPDEVTHFNFNCQVTRVSPTQNGQQFNIFIPFKEKIRNFFRIHSNVFEEWKKN